MSGGWIKLHRSLADNPLWQSLPFSEGQAWVDLLLHTNHKDGHVVIRGNVVQVKRGQIAWSILTMSKRWGWDRGRATRFIKNLKKMGMIEQQSDHLTTVITICNYDTFQENKQQTQQQTPQQVQQQTLQQTPHKQEVSNNKEISNSSKSKRNGLQKPEHVSEQTWADFLQHRNGKKAPVTKTALTRLQNSAEKANMSLEEVMGLMMERGWQGFDPAWVQDGKAKQEHLSVGGL